MATSSTNPNYTFTDPSVEREKELERMREENRERTAAHAKWKAKHDKWVEENDKWFADFHAKNAEEKRLADEAEAKRQSEIIVVGKGRLAFYSVLIGLWIVFRFCWAICWFVVRLCLGTLGLFIGLKVGGDIWNSSLRR